MWAQSPEGYTEHFIWFKRKKWGPKINERKESKEGNRKKTAHDTRDSKKRTRKQHSLLVSALKYTHLPMWLWHTQRWAVRRWTASWQSGRSVSAQGRVCRSQEESQTSTTEDNKQNESERNSVHNIWSDCLPKWKHKLLTETFAYKWVFILNKVLYGFWIWSIRLSGYVNFWTETLQLLSKKKNWTEHTSEWSRWFPRLRDTFPPLFDPCGLICCSSACVVCLTDESWQL